MFKLLLLIKENQTSQRIEYFSMHESGLIEIICVIVHLSSLGPVSCVSLPESPQVALLVVSARAEA